MRLAHVLSTDLSGRSPRNIVKVWCAFKSSSREKKIKVVSCLRTWEPFLQPIQITIAGGRQTQICNSRSEHTTVAASQGSLWASGCHQQGWKSFKSWGSVEKSEKQDEMKSITTSCLPKTYVVSKLRPPGSVEEYRCQFCYNFYIHTSQMWFVSSRLLPTWSRFFCIKLWPTQSLLSWPFLEQKKPGALCTECRLRWALKKASILILMGKEVRMHVCVYMWPYPHKHRKSHHTLGPSTGTFLNQRLVISTFNPSATATLRNHNPLPNIWRRHSQNLPGNSLYLGSHSHHGLSLRMPSKPLRCSFAATAILLPSPPPFPYAADKGCTEQSCTMYTKTFLRHFLNYKCYTYVCGVFWGESNDLFFSHRHFESRFACCLSCPK